MWPKWGRERVVGEEGKGSAKVVEKLEEVEEAPTEESG